MDGVRPIPMASAVASNTCTADFCAAERCSEALGYFLKQCDPCPPFPEPWDWVIPSGDCRRTVSDPTSVLQALQGRFEDDILLAAQLMVRRPDSEMRLHPRLCALDGLLFAVRDPDQRRIVDVLAPRGLLSHQTQSVNVPILPATREAWCDSIAVLATVDLREAALLRSLALPFVLVRGVRSLKFADLKEFWRAKGTAVAGCRPMLSPENGHTQTASNSPAASSFSLARSGVATSAQSSNISTGPVGGSAGAEDSPEDVSSTADLADTDDDFHDDFRADFKDEVDANAAALERPDAEALAEIEEEYSNDFLDETTAGEIRDVELIFAGCTLLTLSTDVSTRLVATMDYLREANSSLGLGRELPGVWSPTANYLDCLRFALRLHELEPVREWFQETLSRCWSSLEKFCPPSTTGQPTLTLEAARSRLLAQLTEPMRRNMKPSLEPLNDANPLKRAHEAYAAVVEHTCVEPIMSFVVTERDPTVAELVRRLAETVRTSRLIEPYVAADVVPDKFLIGINISDLTPAKFLVELDKKFLQLSKAYESRKRRWR